MIIFHDVTFHDSFMTTHPPFSQSHAYGLPAGSPAASYEQAYVGRGEPKGKICVCSLRSTNINEVTLN